MAGLSSRRAGGFRERNHLASRIRTGAAYPPPAARSFIP